jgi:uncharacterized membrane protein
MVVASIYGFLLGGLPLLVVLSAQAGSKEGVGAFSGLFACSALVISLAAVGSVILVGFIFTTFFGTARQMSHDIEANTARTDAVNRLNKRLLSGEINEYEYRRQLALLGQPGR